MRHLRVLGLVDQLVTGPLWRFAEQSESVLDTCEYAEDMLRFVRRVIASPSKIFTGELPSLATRYPDKFHTSGALYAEIIGNSPPTKKLLGSLTKVFRVLESRICEEFQQYLPGGEYCHADALSREETSSAPATNRRVESGFGLLDFHYRRAPNARFFRRAAVTLFNLNGTCRWVESQSREAVDSMLETAFRHAKVVEREEKEHVKRVEEETMSRLEEKRDDLAVKNANAARRANGVFERVSRVGVVNTEKQIDALIEGKPSTAAMSLVKDQIRYRKLLAPDSPSSHLFRFSEEGKVFGLEKLVENLALLIRLVPVDLNAGDEAEYDGARVTIDFVTEGGEPVRGEGTVEAVEGEKPVRVL